MTLVQFSVLQNQNCISTDLIAVGDAYGKYFKKSSKLLTFISIHDSALHFKKHILVPNI
jgi:hypothetical protein